MLKNKNDDNNNNNNNNSNNNGNDRDANDEDDFDGYAAKKPFIIILPSIFYFLWLVSLFWSVFKSSVFLLMLVATEHNILLKFVSDEL